MGLMQNSAKPYKARYTIVTLPFLQFAHKRITNVIFVVWWSNLYSKYRGSSLLAVFKCSNVAEKLARVRINSKYSL